MVAAAVVGSAVVSGVASQAAAKKQARAAGAASEAQTAQAYAAMDQQQAQFDRVRELLQPYVNAGNDALGNQRNLVGLNGAEAQLSSINAIKNSPYFDQLVAQGENSIRQNASATGGLRGGNIQGALAQFAPNMLAAAIDQQYQRLGGLSSLGQNAAAGVGNAGMNAANANSQLLTQAGQAQAGGYLGQAAGQVQGINGISSAFGTGLSGLSSYFNSPTYSSGITGTSGGNAGAYSTGATLNNNFGGGASTFF